MNNEEKRVREFAYQIWESEGKPEGHEARHWEMARKLVEAEALAPTKPKAAKAKPKPKAQPAAKAAKAAEKPAETKKPRAPRKPSSGT